MPSTLILLPGLHGTADLFPPFLAVIPSQYPRRVITYPTDRLCSYPALLQQIETQLQNESDLILIAESFSGPLALHFAAAHPTRVRAVILCASFISPPVPRILCYLATPLVLLRFPILGLGVRIFLAGRRASHALVESVIQSVESIHPHILAHRIIQAASINAQTALAQCTAPILILAASRDRLVGPRSIRRIRRLRPDLPIHTLNTPHLLLQTNPTEAWQLIAQFLTLHSLI